MIRPRSDQLGHGIGVNLDTYPVAGLDHRLRAVQSLEAMSNVEGSASFHPVSLPAQELT